LTAFFVLDKVQKKRLRVWEHTTDNPTGFPSGERLRVWEHTTDNPTGFPSGERLRVWEHEKTERKS
jgi:hypothetical protein